MTPKLAKLLDGVRFPGKRLDVYWFSVGQYGTGEAGVEVWGAGGCGDKLTVNIVLDREYQHTAPLAPDEFFVKWLGEGGLSYPSAFSAALDELGWFEDTGDRIDAGFVAAYAARWRLARCSKTGDYRAGCAHCRELVAVEVKHIQDRLIAQDTIARLSSKVKGR